MELIKMDCGGQEYKIVETGGGNQIFYPVGGELDITVPPYDEMIDNIQALCLSPEIIELIKTPVTACRRIKYWNGETGEWCDVIIPLNNKAEES